MFIFHVPPAIVGYIYSSWAANSQAIKLFSIHSVGAVLGLCTAPKESEEWKNNPALHFPDRKCQHQEGPYLVLRFFTSVNFRTYISSIVVVRLKRYLTTTRHP